MVTKEEWKEWKSLDATKEFINLVMENLDAHRLMLNQHNSFESYKEACGYIRALENIIYPQLANFTCAAETHHQESHHLLHIRYVASGKVHPGNLGKHLHAISRGEISVQKVPAAEVLHPQGDVNHKLDEGLGRQILEETERIRHHPSAHNSVCQKKNAY